MFLLNGRRGLPRRPATTGRGLRTPNWRPSAAAIRMLVAAAIIAVAIALVFLTAAFWVNWWWFGSIGQRPVLVTRYVTQALSFLIGGSIAAIFSLLNLRLASRALIRSAADPVSQMARQLGGLGRILWWTGGALVFVLFGRSAAAQWDTWLLLRYGGSFGVTDPSLGRDAGFYVFDLPAIHAILSGAERLALLTLASCAVVYAVRLNVRLSAWRRPPAPVVTHLAALGGGLLLLIAASFWLANYDLAYSTRGFLSGPGFTDMHVVRAGNVVLALLTAVIALLLLLNTRVARRRWLLIAVAAWGVIALLVGVALPAIVQQSVVEPSELRRERPYIERNLAMTRTAFGLDDVTVRDVAGSGEPPAAALATTSDTFDNARLWDYRVIQDTYQQLRSFVPYYRFHDVDVDRYQVDGRLRQVVISARELDQDGLPENAQTWVNRHLAYTHGYGAAVSPVSESTGQGLPIFLVGNIPPEGTGTLAIQQPEIYYGELTREWIAVNTKQPEFSGLQSDESPSPYGGDARGSIRLSSYLTRLLVAADLGDRRILLSGDLTTESRILIRRDIVERARTVAPFLSYDPDPYLVIAGGRLVWVLDAYTTSDRFPTASPVEGINYIRNSVKITVDAYDGTTTFYRTDVADPIADAYDAMFDSLFTPIASAPPALLDHVRYPERLFNLQTDVYASYHVTDPIPFYNGEDRWAVPTEPTGGERSRMEAYYASLRLGDASRARFGLILPLVPGGQQDRSNMTAWMAGQTDETGKPSVLLYRFPRQVTVFGPEQVEAQINQDRDISPQLSLLDQAGSRVIRGNLLVLPIDETIIYVQPLYVQATSSQAAPTELKYVIVATNNRVIMRATLREALEALANGAAAAPPAAPSTSAPEPTPAALAQEALDAYDRGQTALKAGNWEAYGREQQTLSALLQQLAGAEGNPAAPASTGAPATGTPGP